MLCRGWPPVNMKPFLGCELVREQQVKTSSGEAAYGFPTVCSTHTEYTTSVQYSTCTVQRTLKQCALLYCNTLLYDELVCTCVDLNQEYFVHEYLFYRVLRAWIYLLYSMQYPRVVILRNKHTNTLTHKANLKYSTVGYITLGAQIMLYACWVL